MDRWLVAAGSGVVERAAARELLLPPTETYWAALERC